MRSILVHADRGGSSAAMIESGLSLARMTGGHLSVVVDTPVARYIAMDPLGGAYVASAAMQQALEDDDAHAAAIESRLTGQDVSFNVIRSETDPIDALGSAARLADVIIVSKAGNIAGELALNARTPVLVVPGGTTLTLPLDCICIAWDGGNEAALALRMCVPLLAGGGTVHVLTVSEKAGGFPATGAMSYLSRHGIKAELTELVRAGSVAETLAAAVDGLGGQLLVMGAYGKSRMREFIFGGVTNHFLANPNGPALLLAH